MADEVEEEDIEELDEDLEDDLEVDGEVEPLEADEIELDELEDEYVNARNEDYIESNYEQAVKANPKRMSMLKKRARVIEGIVDATKIRNPDDAERLWQKLAAETDTEVKRDYNIKEVYGENDVIEHPNFGTGFVIQILSPTKTEVLFEDGLKRLAFNKG